MASCVFAIALIPFVYRSPSRPAFVLSCAGFCCFCSLCSCFALSSYLVSGFWGVSVGAFLFLGLGCCHSLSLCLPLSAFLSLFLSLPLLSFSLVFSLFPSLLLCALGLPLLCFALFSSLYFLPVCPSFLLLLFVCCCRVRWCPSVALGGLPDARGCSSACY